MQAQSVLHIIVPGLSGPLIELETVEKSKIYNRWQRKLSQSKIYATNKKIDNLTQGFEKKIIDLFKLEITKQNKVSKTESFDTNLPTAALSLLAHNKYNENLFYLFADPVHLQVGIDQAILQAATELDISDEQSIALEKSIKEHLHQDDISFFRLNNKQWIIAAKKPINIQTTVLDNAVGRNVNYLLPKGKDKNFWNQRLTELQMLMYTHEVNQQREAKAQQSINSLWFYGEGTLPAFKQNNIASLASNNDCVKGIAHLTNTRFFQLDKTETKSSFNAYKKFIMGLTNQSQHVLHLNNLNHLVNYNDTSLWLEKFEMLLNLWIYPLIKFANQNNFQLIISPCLSKSYQISKYDSLKFWKKSGTQAHTKKS